MKDRISLYPGRVKLVPVKGQENIFDMIRADDPTQEGNPLCMATFLKHATAFLYGKDENAVPDDIFVKLFPAMPTGTISWLASETIPDGFLKCDGSSVAKEDYPDLYAVIGDTFGEGTDTTFQLPDLRAKFIRGAGTNGNYSAVFGQTQEGSVLNSNPWAMRPTITNEEYSFTGYSGMNYGGSASASNTSYYYGMRPYNIALTPIIKFCGG